MMVQTNPVASDTLIDPVQLTQALVGCPSITPHEGGALELLETTLTGLGFVCHRLSFQEEGTQKVENLFAKFGSGHPHFCFAGHTDVVPAGDSTSWRHDPFQGTIEGDHLYGRGTVDMKGAIAAFVAAVSRVITNGFQGSISLLITGDEEGIAINGTRKVLEWLESQGEKIDFCLVGEPSSQKTLGDTIKIGRRGSLNTRLTLFGTQGHVAFPHLSDNPMGRMLEVLSLLNKGPEEKPSQYFAPSNLEITSIDVGNKATNVIPEKVTAMFNIRFHDQHTCQSLSQWIRSICDKTAGRYDVNFEFSGEAEFLEPNDVTQDLVTAIQEVTGQRADCNTHGATSDARFIRHYAPVLEFGLVGRTMHQVNECVAVKDLENLTQIYGNFLTRYFKI